MERFLRVLMWSLAIFCVAQPQTRLWAADDTPQQLAEVTAVTKVAIRSVDPAREIVTIEIEFSLDGKSSATVTRAELEKFFIDDVEIMPQPIDTSFELKPKQTIGKILSFEAPLTPNMAKLMKKFGNQVRASGTLRITAQSHGTLSLLNKKTVSGESPFNTDTLLAKPDDRVLAAFGKVPFFGADSSKDDSAKETGKRDSSDQSVRDDRRHDSNNGPNSQSPEAWKTEMRQRGQNNIVIIEASAGLGFAKLYRQGYRISERDVIAPLDLLDPVKGQIKQGGIIGGVASIASDHAPSEMQKVIYRAWTAGEQSAPNSDRITNNDPVGLLEFKFKLGIGGPGVDLGVFEFTNPPQRSWEPIPTDIEPAFSRVPAMELSYMGLPEGQPFTSATLAVTPLSGSINQGLYYLDSKAAPMTFGSPVFSQNGWLAIVNHESFVVTSADIQRLLKNSRTAKPPESAPKPDPLPTMYRVKVWSNPSGAAVSVNHKPVYDETKHRIETASSKEECTGQNTILLPKGSYYISFMYDGYRTFGGTVVVDDDMTLGATLKR